VDEDISPFKIVKFSNFKARASQEEKYHNMLVAEGESVSSMTETSKIFSSC